MPDLQQYEVNVFPNCQESLYVTAEFPPYCRSQSNQPPRGQVASKPALSQQQQRYSAQPQQPQQLPLPQSVSSHASKVLSTHSSSHRGLTNSSSGQATPLQNTASKTIVCESPRVYKTQQGVYTNISDLKLNELKISSSASGNSQPQSHSHSQSQAHSHSQSHSQSQHQQQQQPRFEVHNGIQYELAPVVYEDRTGGISPRPSPQPCGACGVSSREQQQCSAPTGPAQTAPAQTAPAPTGPAPTGPAPSQSVVNKVASRPLLPGQLNPRTTSSPPVPPTPAPLGPTLSGFQQQQQRTLSTPPAVPPLLQSAALPAGGFSGVYAPLRPSSGVSPSLSRPPQPCPPGFPANPQLSAPFGAPQLPQTPAPFNFPLRPPALSLPQQQFSRLLPATPPPPPQFGRIPVQAAPCAPPALPPALPLPALPPPQAPFSFGAPQLPQFPQFPPSLPALPPPQAPFSFGAPQLPQFPPQLPQSSCGCGAGPAPLALPPQLPPLPPQLPLALPPPQLPCGPPPLPPMPCGPPPCGPRPQCNFSFGGFAPVSRVVGCGGGLFGGRGCCGGGLGRGCCSGNIGNQCCGPSGIRIGKSNCQQKRQRCAFIRKRRAVYIGPPIIGTLPKPPALPCPPPPCPPPCPRPC